MKLLKVMRLLLIVLSFCFAGMAKSQAQYVYTENKEAKVCFKKFCDTDTISLASIKKVRSLTLQTDAEGLKIVEFTIMLTDANEGVYVARIPWDYMDRNNLDLLSRGYVKMQITDIVGKAKDGHMVRFKPTLYYIVP